MGDSTRNTRRHNAPFVLLDDARAGDEGRARLYTDPREIIIARRPDEVAPALARIEARIAQGYACAGHIGYEAGLALEPRLAPLAAARSGADGPLVWMGAFDGWQDMAGAQVGAWLAAHAAQDPAPRIGPMVPAIGPGAYAAAFDHIAEAIRAGDIYQANFTFPLAGPWAGDPLALYAQLRASGGGGHRHGGGGGLDAVGLFENLGEFRSFLDRQVDELFGEGVDVSHDGVGFLPQSAPREELCGILRMG